MRVNYSGRNAPTVTRCLMACRRMRTTLRVRENSRARISPRRGERLPRFQETRCPTHCWSTQGPALRRPALDVAAVPWVHR